MVLLLLFYLISLLLISCCLFVVFTTKPVTAILSLIGCFFLTAILYIILNQEFIAVIQVLVYAGAIVVLFIFVIMLLNLGKQEQKLNWKNLNVWVSSIFIFALCFKIISIILSVKGDGLNLKQGVYTEELISQKGSIELFSEALFYEYILAFEFISLLLLVSVIAVLVLGKKNFTQK